MLAMEPEFAVFADRMHNPQDYPCGPTANIAKVVENTECLTLSDEALRKPSRPNPRTYSGSSRAFGLFTLLAPHTAALRPTVTIAPGKNLGVASLWRAV
jgi:hypothetical protein